MTPVTAAGDYLRCASCGARRRRCQLLVGHEGAHAAMAFIRRARTIKTWQVGQMSRPEPATVAYRFAWAPGFPSVAEDLAVPIEPAATRSPRRLTSVA